MVIVFAVFFSYFLFHFTIFFSRIRLTAYISISVEQIFKRKIKSGKKAIQEIYNKQQKFKIELPYGTEEDDTEIVLFLAYDEWKRQR